MISRWLHTFFLALAAALLAPYFRRSQRVKRTFVNP
ncbi:MAG: DUF2569 family protein [Acidovorax sp.]|nr:DUF2569 family protein [Acidovorax sp.]